MKFFISSDHGGFDLKEQIKSYLEEKGLDFEDLGVYTKEKPGSYAVQGHLLAKKVLGEKNVYGIGLCGTGLGISYALNRHNGIRAARVLSKEDAFLAKLHNNANIMVFGGRQMSIEKAKEIIDTFMETKYEGGRHQERIDAIDL